jgi:hypothetical protein
MVLSDLLRYMRLIRLSYWQSIMQALDTHFTVEPKSTRFSAAMNRYYAAENGPELPSSDAAMATLVFRVVDIATSIQSPSVRHTPNNTNLTIAKSILVKRYPVRGPLCLWHRT